LEFGTSTSEVIWRNEIECAINDSNPEYFHPQSLFWLTPDTFVTKDIERTDQTSPPRVDIFKVSSFDGKKLILQQLWTGWSEYRFDSLTFNKR
jgi:hypothetical protein